MTLGIPTQSDVKDEKYKLALKQEEIENKLRWIPTSKVEILNAINSNYKKTDVSATEALDKYIKATHNYENALFEGNRKEIVKGYVKYFTNTHPNEKRVNQSARFPEILNYKIPIRNQKVKIKETSKIRQKINPNEKYKIQFNPYSLLISELDTFKYELKNSVKERNNLEDLLSMEKVIDDFNNNANIELAKDNLMKRFQSPYSFEGDKKTEAYKLNRKHKEISNESNLYLSFHENYWITEDGTHIPIEGDLPKTKYEVEKFLENTNQLRELIEIEIKKTGTIIFNGILIDSYQGLIDNFRNQTQQINLPDHFG
ncbi:hypothetical protein GW932_04480 [archaeon]|nr:hypothetical protein [archaeon]